MTSCPVALYRKADIPTRLENKVGIAGVFAPKGVPIAYPVKGGGRAEGREDPFPNCVCFAAIVIRALICDPLSTLIPLPLSLSLRLTSCSPSVRPSVLRMTLIEGEKRAGSEQQHRSEGGRRKGPPQPPKESFFLTRNASQGPILKDFATSHLG